MLLLLLYWGFLAAGYIAASKLRKNADKFGFTQKAMMWTIYILVFIMGLRMGVNDQVTSNLGVIGIQALIMTVFAIAGSVLAIHAVRKILKIDKYGNLIDKNQTNTEDNSKQDNKKDNAISKSDIQSTLIILGLVVAGMLIGCLIIVRYLPGILETFDIVSGHALTVFLCILLGFVGFELGLSGNIAANIKVVGLKACAFPIAAVAGSLILGAASGLFFGFSVREGIAISAGFGWYTYAPTVIASAGSQYAVASAVSFMHNVIRELSGIILIPILAKKIGYLEVTGIPGVAAMDMCIPIVERSCRHDTVVYSFAIGLVMCVATSVLVPLVMGV